MAPFVIFPLVLTYSNSQTLKGQQQGLNLLYWPLSSLCWHGSDSNCFFSLIFRPGVAALVFFFFAYH